jgi:transposase
VIYFPARLKKTGGEEHGQKIRKFPVIFAGIPAGYFFASVFYAVFPRLARQRCHKDLLGVVNTEPGRTGMTISADLEAKILRFYHVEQWRIGTIARQFSIHHSTVRRVLAQAGIPKAAIVPKKSILDPFLPWIMETLTRYPTLTASRLYAMACERGYPGGEDHFRHLMAYHRPAPQPEAYLRLRTLPGEQAQVDWAHFGSITIGKAKRTLMAFVMVLSFSRKIFLRFYLDARMSNFLRGHEAAFQSFGGVPRVVLYDNLRSAVLEREGDAIRFHPTLLAFSAHYRFEPRPVAIARGNEKGRVERAIRYVRDNFFPARIWKTLEDLNNQAQYWANTQAANRPCPEEFSKSVHAVFAQEKPHLFPLPQHPYPTAERAEARVGKTPYIRFDLNDYSVPHTTVGRLLTVIAEPNTVTIIDGLSNILAQHPRCYDKGRQIEDPAHIEALVQQKAKARQHRGQDRLVQAVPKAQVLLIQAAARGYSLRSTITACLIFLDSYGAVELEYAIGEAIVQQSPHPNTLRLILEKRRNLTGQPPPLPVELPQDARVRQLTVRPHSLHTYDQLNTEKTHDESQ